MNPLYSIMWQHGQCLIPGTQQPSIHGASNFSSDQDKSSQLAESFRHDRNQVCRADVVARMLLAVDAASCLHKAGAVAWWLSVQGPAVSGKFLCQDLCITRLSENCMQRCSFGHVLDADVLSLA